ncbi:hypothetical protein [Streptomyces flaveolus]
MVLIVDVQHEAADQFALDLTYDAAASALRNELKRQGEFLTDTDNA